MIVNNCVYFVTCLHSRNQTELNTCDNRIVMLIVLLWKRAHYHGKFPLHHVMCECRFKWSNAHTSSDLALEELHAVLHFELATNSRGAAAGLSRWTSSLSAQAIRHRAAANCAWRFNINGFRAPSGASSHATDFHEASAIRLCWTGNSIWRFPPLLFFWEAVHLCLREK